MFFQCIIDFNKDFELLPELASSHSVQALSVFAAFPLSRIRACMSLLALTVRLTRLSL